MEQLMSEHVIKWRRRISVTVLGYAHLWEINPTLTWTKRSWTATAFEPGEVLALNALADCFYMTLAWVQSCQNTPRQVSRSAEKRNTFSLISGQTFEAKLWWDEFTLNWCDLTGRTPTNVGVLVSILTSALIDGGSSERAYWSQWIFESGAVSLWLSRDTSS